ncbi:MAG TPA: XdhC family protein [Noviherbaspirillum sp.]|nr:XdhC family protein [Noviherbaspirillum sp.]
MLTDALAWCAAGKRVWIVTVVRTWGVSPRPVGSWAALNEDGLLSGSVSGGCVEDDLLHRLQAGELHRATPFFLEYGVRADEAHHFGLPCGGTLRLLVEPAPQRQQLDELAVGLECGNVVAREVEMATGTVSLRPAESGEDSQLAGNRFVAVWGPRWRLLIVGAGQIARYLAPVAQSVGFGVTVTDPRFEAEQAWNPQIAPMVRDMPDDFLAHWRPDAHSAIVAVAHDPKIDDMVLLEALKSPAFFVGVIGSHATQHKRRDRLRQFDLEEWQIGRLRGPVGLSIGSRTPPEIAVSIAAELIAVRNGKKQPNPDSQQGPLAATTQIFNRHTLACSE